MNDKSLEDFTAPAILEPHAWMLDNNLITTPMQYNHWVKLTSIPVWEGEMANQKYDVDPEAHRLRPNPDTASGPNGGPSQLPRRDVSRRPTWSQLTFRYSRT